MRANFGGEIQQPRQFEDFQRLQRRAFHAQARHDGSGVGVEIEARAHGRSARGRLRLRRRPPIFNRFGRFRESRFDGGPIGARREPVQLGASQGGADKSREQRPKLFELQYRIGVHKTPSL